MRNPRCREQGPSLLEKLAVGSLTTEGDPIEPHPSDSVGIGGGDHASQQRRRGRQDRDIFVGSRTGDAVRIARRRHDHPPTGEDCLQPHLGPCPSGGVIDEDPTASMPLLRKTGRGQEGVP